MSHITDQELWQKIEHFIRQESGVSKRKTLTPDTCIVENLKIDGEDGVELVEKYGATFNVNLDSFNYHNYFYGDYFDPLGLSSLILYIKRKIYKESPPTIPKHKKPLTLKMLYNSAIEGRWLY